jgi:hypothetical protein
MTYRTLDANSIEKTIETLYRRIAERFPERGITKLCAELLAIAREDREVLAWVAKPNMVIRAGVIAAILAGAAGLVWLTSTITSMQMSDEAFNALQGIDAAVNTVVLAGAASWFLLNLETTWRREAVLKDLHELRSIAHVVDMHQLTKDPTVKSGAGTAATKEHGLSEFELVRYLDYCSEMLSLTGKLAALYMQNVRDPVIIQAVNEIEDLTGNMSRKIWQKIMILRQPGYTPGPWAQ